MDRLEIDSAAALRDWLAIHHDRGDGVLLVTWKASHRERHVGRDAVLDALVAHGWIDGRRWRVDDDRTAQLISPRRTKAWAASYKRRADRLAAEGLMHAAGEASVAEAKAAGLWDKTTSVDALIVPDDLAGALATCGGRAWFDGAAPSYRRNVLRWIDAAKRPPTRARRVDIVAAHAARGEKVANY
jgi:uncharacterized protein YdeI (YjbR/CyaY-like superfamily)